MLACQYGSHRAGLKVMEVELPPPPGLGQVVVEIHSASLNPIDFKTHAGTHLALFNFRWPRVIGFDFSGVVSAVGEQEEELATDGVRAALNTLKVGDRVFGMISGLPQRDSGTVAQFCCVSASVCELCPSNLSHDECASLPLVSITAGEAFMSAGLKCVATSTSYESNKDNKDNEGDSVAVSKNMNITTSTITTPALTEGNSSSRLTGPRTGPRVLVTGGSGGVGSIAIQLAKELFGASYVCTTASPSSFSLMKSLGADETLDYHGIDWGQVQIRLEHEEGVERERGEGKFDAILDCTGEASQLVGLLNSGGGLCSITASPSVDALREWFNKLEKKDRATVTCGVGGFLHSSLGGGVFDLVSGAQSLRSRCEALNAHYSHIVGAPGGQPVLKRMLPLLKEGAVHAVIDKTFAMQESPEAFAYLQQGRAKGKVVIQVKDR